MNILVTGGAGYVGSIVSEQLLEKGYRVVVFDNLQQGHKAAVPPGAEFVLADIADAAALEAAFKRFRIDAVMHMAAETVIEYSITDPKLYFHNNVVGGISLLDAMLERGISKLIFSSTAAVYGEPRTVPIDEDAAKVPVNSYGESKLMFEGILRWYERAYGLKHVSFRYFNATGASERLGEDHRPETHLIPNVLKVALKGDEPVPVFGTDYPTGDGSCIRDYVHVIDIARAHILALEKIDGLSGRAYNLGSSTGYSVIEVIEAVKRVTKQDVRTVVGPRRAGDPAVLVAGSGRAKLEIGWVPEFSEIDSIIESAWGWMKRHPEGYEA